VSGEVASPDFSVKRKDVLGAIDTQSQSPGGFLANVTKGFSIADTKVRQPGA
jgi:hypothetical protein